MALILLHNSLNLEPLMKKKFFNLLLLALLVPNCIFADDSITSRLDIKNLSIKEQSIALEILDEVEKRLPPVLFDLIQKNSLKFKFEKKKGRFNNPEQFCQNITSTNQSNNFEYGSYIDLLSSISLNRELLKMYQSNFKEKCGSFTFKERVLATISHELFHFYDYRFKENRLSQFDGCKDFKDTELFNEENSLRGRCKLLFQNYKRSLEVSQDLIFKRRSKSNSLSFESSPDIYEHENQKEQAAVNFEYFLFDPQYKCRRPLLYNYYSQVFNSHPYQNVECNNFFTVLHKDQKTLIHLDPSRIYQIQYLLASKGDSAESGYGHSMIKFVVCAPERKHFSTGVIIPATPYGEECLKDTSFHIVASFGGNIDEMTLNIAKGLFGGYNSVLSFSYYTEIQYDYNRIQLRDLYSIPVNYFENEKKLFIQRMISDYWDYRGDYKFLSNNCATETANAFLSILNYPTLNQEIIDTPYAVIDILKDNKLVSSNFKSDQLELLDNKFKSEAVEKYLKVAYNSLFPDLEYSREELFKYFAKSSLERRAILNRPLKTLKEVSSFTFLEKSAWAVLESYRSKKVTEILEEKIDNANKVYSQQQNLLTLGTRSFYGIPNTEELNGFVEFIQTNSRKLDFSALLMQIEVPEIDNEINEITKSLKIAQKRYIQIKANR